jgi:hypothetical protein
VDSAVGHDLWVPQFDGAEAVGKVKGQDHMAV